MITAAIVINSLILLNLIIVLYCIREYKKENKKLQDHFEVKIIRQDLLKIALRHTINKSFIDSYIKEENRNEIIKETIKRGLIQQFSTFIDNNFNFIEIIENENYNDYEQNLIRAELNFFFKNI